MHNNKDYVGDPYVLMTLLLQHPGILGHLGPAAQLTVVVVVKSGQEYAKDPAALDQLYRFGIVTLRNALIAPRFVTVVTH
jgi:hypothetical protein